MKTSLSSAQRASRAAEEAREDRQRREAAKKRLAELLRQLAGLIETDTAEARGELADHVDSYWHAISVGKEELGLILNERLANSKVTIQSSRG